VKFAAGALFFREVFHYKLQNNVSILYRNNSTSYENILDPTAQGSARPQFCLPSATETTGQATGTFPRHTGTVSQSTGYSSGDLHHWQEQHHIQDAGTGSAF
jgi:hypothetical protein